MIFIILSFVANMDTARKVINKVLDEYLIDTRMSESNEDQLACAFGNFLQSQGFVKKSGNRIFRWFMHIHDLKLSIFFTLKIILFTYSINRYTPNGCR